MKTLNLDLETFSPENLTKSGVYRYAHHPGFTILLFAYSIDAGPVEVVDLGNGDTLPGEITAALTDPAVQKRAWNAAFERTCLSAHLGVKLDPSQWRCTMIWAATLGLPMSLDHAGAVLGVEQPKMVEGKRLIKKFCVPSDQSLLTGAYGRTLPEEAPDDWATFKAYNRRDVEVELEIQQRLSRYPVPDLEWDYYAVDQAINDCGIGIDVDLAGQALDCDRSFRERKLARAAELTGLANPNSPIQLLDWLDSKGLPLDALTKDDVAAAIPDTEGDVREVLQLRQELSKSSVKKYQAMMDVAVDGRAHGLLQFYGAGRTGRWAGRLIQVQNLPRNYMPDLDLARAFLTAGDHDILELLYPSVTGALSELIRTAFIPQEGHEFVVADFSAIEARVLAWLAGEQWRLDLFAAGGDIYCQSASKMFGVPVGKNGPNADLRQKGKVAELACIAEGQPVLTERGLVPIEQVTLQDRVWDGQSWVTHDGVIYQGTKEVFTYDYLTATADHIVWVEGEPEPLRFDDAAARGARLLQTGDGRNPVWVGDDHFQREALVPELESLPSPHPVHRVWERTVAESLQSDIREIEGLPGLLPATPDTALVGSPVDGRETALHEHSGPSVSGIRRTWDRVSVPVSARSRAVAPRERGQRDSGLRNGSDQHGWPLRPGQSEIHSSSPESREPAADSHVGVGPAVLALRTNSGDPDAVIWNDEAANHRAGRASGGREAQKLAGNTRTARVYDIRNAGPHHRYTVSGRLVHNCGYGGSVGALKAMGALTMGLDEAELQPIVTAWRDANPAITRLWWDIDEQIKHTVTTRETTTSGPLSFAVESGILFITLPSGRRLAYVKPRIGVNRFGGDCVTYEGVGVGRRWERIDSYGPKFVENIIQAISRDLLAHALKTVHEAGHRIVMHVHDEIVVETPKAGGATVADIVALMCDLPSWAGGLQLDADGYRCDFYQKD